MKDTDLYRQVLGLKSLIENIKANARGLPNFANFRILFYCAKLDMVPP